MPLCTFCLCGRKKRPQISGPLHLLFQSNDLGAQNHAFHSKVFLEPLPCHLCRSPIYQQGSSCQNCKVSCHYSCQSKVLSACEGSCHLVKKHYDGIRKPPILHSSSQKTAINRPLVYPVTKQYQPLYHHYSDYIEMDLTYVTERVIAVTFPFMGMEKLYRDNLKEVTLMLKTKHGDKYMVFNLSEKRYDISRINHQILNFGWPDRLAPPLERLCSICKAMDSWLNADPHHIVVLHCKGGKERTGVVIEAYRHYSNICANADQALDRFAMKRFYDDKIGSLTQPSQKRYVRYFSGLLSGSIKINSSPLYLNQVIIHGVPNFDGKGGCRAFIKIYQSLQPIYSSGIFNMRRVTIPLDVPLQLRGDILIKCYHKSRPSAREIIFRCQFHTCAVSEYTLMLSKDELDDACQDKRFPEDGRVEIKFSSGPDNFQGSNVLHGASLPSESSNDPIIRWDSYENFDVIPEDNPENINELDGWDSSVNHTQGPVDGNLYATIGKKRIPLNGAVEDLVNGVHTISMDSGISSASGHPTSTSTTPLYSGTTSSPGIVNGTFSTSSSPVVRAEIHNSPISEEHSKLDEVLSGMLQDVQSMPDIKPSSRSYTVKTSTVTYSTEIPSGNVQNGKYNPNQEASIEEEEDSDTPYHSRKDSQPFTYLVPTSPATQRKALLSKSTARTPSPTRSATLPLTSERTKHSISNPTTPEPKSDEEFLENPSAWLSKQQQKLKERQEARFHSDRHHRENRLINELRNAQSKFAPFHSDSSFEDDAYLSDTIASLEAFSSREPSPVKGVSHSVFSTPLHINTYNGYSQQSQPSSSHTTSKPPIYQSSTTGRGSSAPSSPLIPSRSSSRDIRNRYVWPATQQKPVQRQRSDTSHDRERPFVSVKRAHEQARKQADPNYPTFHQTFAYTQYQQPPPPSQNLLQSTYPQMVPLATSSPTTKSSTPSSGLLTTVTPSKPLEAISPVPGSSRLEELELTLQNVSSPSSSNADRRLQKVPSSVDGHNIHSDDSLSPSKIDDRPATPGFPVQSRTPYSNREPSPLPGQTAGLPPKSPTSSRRAFALSSSGGSSVRNQLRRWPSNPSLSSNNWSKDRSPSPSTVQQLQASLLSQTPEAGQTFSSTGQSSPSVYVGQSCRSSLTSLVEPSEIISDSPLFMKDTSKFWYKPNINREDAINVLKDKPPGTFIVRDSNSFPGAYGLALKVATLPPNIQNKSGDISNELVRHFLIEPTSQGVRLKGCANEPVFGSLSALVYQHSITPMALPCKLLLPKSDVTEQIGPEASPNSAAQLLAQGAACSVLYLYSMDVELLTGPEAVRKASKFMMATKPLPTATTVHFKVSSQGITVTDNNRKLFFRRHYPVNTISHCGLEPGDQRWSEYNEETGQVKSTHRIFGFVAAKTTNPNENQCHLFAELEPEQPAFAIVNFVTKVMMGTSTIKPLIGSNNV